MNEREDTENFSTAIQVFARVNICRAVQADAHVVVLSTRRKKFMTFLFTFLARLREHAVSVSERRIERVQENNKLGIKVMVSGHYVELYCADGITFGLFTWSMADPALTSL